MSFVTLDSLEYEAYQLHKFKGWEALCERCGTCCGSADGDPCEHLLHLKNGKYACKIYENRLGWHRTKSGKRFECVPIQDVLHEPWPGDRHCGYKKLSPWFPTSQRKGPER